MEGLFVRTSPHRLLRPSPAHARQVFDHHASGWGREKALPIYRRALRDIAERLKAQQAEQRLSGLNDVLAALSILPRVADRAQRAAEEMAQFVLARELSVKLLFASTDQEPRDRDAASGLPRASFRRRLDDRIDLIAMEAALWR
jgi:hypothetical protein